MSKFKTCLPYKHHAMKTRQFGSRGRTSDKPSGGAHFESRPGHRLSGTEFGCSTQSLHVISSTVPLKRLSISSLSFQISDS